MTTEADQFRLYWERFVLRWSTARSRVPWKARRDIERALEVGIAAVSGPEVDDPVPPQSEYLPDDELTCELRLLEASGLFDARGYAEAVPDASRESEALRHFCVHGWRDLCNPSPEFDVWWYWTEYLDPEAATINPLLHYALVGRHRGYEPLPVDRRPPSVPQPAGARRRACLFAGYDRDAIVDDYVVAYVKELSRFADVFYMADCYMNQSELAKLEGITLGAWAERHGAYDWGSYSRLAGDLVGWDRLEEYDEVILANDSCYLLRPLDDVFARMDAKAVDWWGMQLTLRRFSAIGRKESQGPVPLDELRRDLPRGFYRYRDYIHSGSYFQAFRQSVTRDPGFRRRMETVAPQPLKDRVVQKYETGFTRYLIATGFAFDMFVEALHPFHPIYSSGAFELLTDGFPFIKRHLITDNPFQVPDLRHWKERVLEQCPEAPVDMFERNLLRVASDDRLQRSMAIVTGEDGAVQVKPPLRGAAFEARDRQVPKFEHWWAFPVDADSHLFTGSARAVFEEVRHDPSLKKIVLTRSRKVCVEGENVVVAPLESPEGRFHLLRSRQVFVASLPNACIPYPISHELHNFIHVRRGIPLQRFGFASRGSIGGRHELANENRRLRAVVTSSRVDSLALTAALYPLRNEDMWATGVPSHDFLLCPEGRLPEDMQDDLGRLREQVGDRRLVLVAPARRGPGKESFYEFSDDEVAWLGDWCERHDAVFGVRDLLTDPGRPYTRMLSALGALDLSLLNYASIEVLYRVAQATVSDYSSSLIDFLLTGRPVVSFAFDLEVYDEEGDGLFYDLAATLPGPVCRDFADLSKALEQLFGPQNPDDRAAYAARRSLFFEHVDGQNAHRLVSRVRELFGEDRGFADSLVRH